MKTVETLYKQMLEQLPMHSHVLFRDHCHFVSVKENSVELVCVTPALHRVVAARIHEVRRALKRATDKDYTIRLIVVGLKGAS